MRKSFLAVAVTASLLPYASIAHAQQAATETETVVVTANRFEQPLSEVIASTTVISKQDIEASQAKSILDVLKSAPGVEVAQNGGRGHNASVFLRGTNSDQTLFLVDGVRIETAAGGSAFNHVPLNLIERIEVIRGPGAALYGSDAIGGVINIITISSESVDESSVSLGAGSEQFREGNFSFQTTGDNGSVFSFAGGYEETEGYDIRRPATGMNFGNENQNIHLSFRKPLNNDFYSLVSLRWFDNLVEYSRSGKSLGGDENLSLTGEAGYNGDSLSSIFRLNYQSIENINYAESQGKNSPSTKKDIDFYNAQFLNLYKVNETFSVGGGVDFRKEELKDGAIGWGTGKLAGKSRDTFGLYTSLDAAFDSLRLNASIRNDKHDEYDDYTTWSVGGLYHVNDNHQLHASIGTSFKAPSYSDLTDNPDLQPEEADSKEIGFSAQYNWFDIEVTGYDNQVDNLIIWFEGTPRWYTRNVDAEIRGVEIALDFSTSFIDHTVIAEFKDHKDSNGNKLAKRADENFKWLASASYENFDFNLNFTYLGERLGNPNETYVADNILPSVSLWDFALGYWVTPEFVVRGRVENLTDENYETAKTYTAPSRRYYLNLTYQF
ncbi:TonB-dependent receptor domain-containing protein [Vibrio sonorensis]|uniref:TonB-dependent receptor domain-containing protein n=1 Tax=Vibrio sonorensis TaxID=1004316 RepID=UPI0008D941C7|nr:TonB-dependent receptor [Vibrio sonorensis]